MTVGIYMGRLTSKLTSPTTRIQGTAVWEIVVFVLNSALFVLIGLQLPNILDGIDTRDTGELLGYGALVAATVMATRIGWVFPLAALIRTIFRHTRGQTEFAPWRHILIIGWTGMRGAVSLAAALALPLETDAGVPFPHRELIVFLTFSVILATLVIQGLSLPPLIHALGVDDHDETLEHEETKARVRAAESALARIDELADEDWVRDDTADRLRRIYDYRLRRFSSRFGDDDGESQGFEERASDYQRLLREVLNAQRAKLLDMRDDGSINDEVMQRIERELDLEDTRLED